MNAEKLLALYERVMDAPDAIARLRRFVLDLAVRGKLVEQDAGEEPASGPLAQARSRLNARAQDAKRMRWMDTDPVAQESCDLPSGWVAARVNDTGLFINGLAFKPTDWKATGLPIIRIQNLTDPRREFNYAQGDFPEEVLVRDGDLLVSWSATLDAFKWNRGNGVLNQHIFRVLPEECLTARDFLLLVLRSAIREMGVGDHARGLVMTHINRGPFLNHIVRIPPLAEQHRIVAKVDELMALLDRLDAARSAREATRDRLTTASLARLTAPDTDAQTLATHARFALDALPSLTARADQIKDLRQTILNLAVRGRLVAQYPQDAPAAVLLAEVAARKEKARSTTGDPRIKPAPTPAPDALGVDLPKGWAIQSFENLFLFIDYRGQTPPKTSDGVPLITAKNVRPGSLNREPAEFVSEETYGRWMTRGFPKVGDIFFTTEAPMANACINDVREPFALAQRVVCLQPYAEMNTQFFVLAIMSEQMQGLIEAHSTGLTAKGIKMAKLKPLPLPVPPLTEQHRIVAKVDELMALCDRLEAALARADTTRARLLEALLAEALCPPQQAAA